MRFSDGDEPMMPTWTPAHVYSDEETWQLVGFFSLNSEEL